MSNNQEGNDDIRIQIVDTTEECNPVVMDKSIVLPPLSLPITQSSDIVENVTENSSTLLATERIKEEYDGDNNEEDLYECIYCGKSPEDMLSDEKTGNYYCNIECYKLYLVPQESIKTYNIRKEFNSINASTKDEELVHGTNELTVKHLKIKPRVSGSEGKKDYVFSPEEDTSKTITTIFLKIEFGECDLHIFNSLKQETIVYKLNDSKHYCSFTDCVLIPSNVHYYIENTSDLKVLNILLIYCNK